MKAPKVCLYCDGTGKADDTNECGFCENGKPLDTQDDWDHTWGPILDPGGSNNDHAH